jgi:hypothetical protein
MRWLKPSNRLGFRFYEDRCSFLQKISHQRLFIMLNWLNRELGTQAPMVGVITVFAFILGADLAYDFVRNFNVNDNDIRSPEVQLNLR